MLHFGKNGQFHQIFSHLVLVWFINCMLLDEYIQFQFLLPNYLFGKIQKLTHPNSCWREISWIFPQKDKNWTKLHVFSYSNRVLRTIDTSAIYNWQTVNVQFYIYLMILTSTTFKKSTYLLLQFTLPSFLMFISLVG